VWFRKRESRGAQLRPRRLFVLALLATAIFLCIINWSWIDAQARAVVVLSSVLETPVLTPVVEVLTEEPRVEETTFAGMPALVARPGGEGPWPAFLFVNGATPEGRMHPQVRDLARGLARAGYLVVVPDLPGLRSDEITGETVSSTMEAARATAERPDARDGQVGLIGVSAGASLALLAAESPDVRERVSVVAGIAPYTDIRTMLSIATTGHYWDGERYVPYETDPFLSYVIARSLVTAVPCEEDRKKLGSELKEIDRLDPNPLAGLRARPTGDLCPEAQSIVELLGNEDPDRFDELYAALPERVREGLDRLSPLAAAEQLAAPVELASAPHDEYFPVSESFALAGIAPDCRVTVTGALDHANPDPSLGDLPAFLSFDGFVARSLREAHRTEPVG
jgi:pimeloyl-ACP methyl ester carboxylesterase